MKDVVAILVSAWSYICMKFQEATMEEYTDCLHMIYVNVLGASPKEAKSTAFLRLDVPGVKY